MRKTVLLLACLCAALPLHAQHPTLDYFLPDTCNYNKAIPVPASVLGFEVAQLQATPEKTAEYYRAVAAASDRVELIQYGWTHERRPLLLAIVSTPENIRNLDKIKASHAALSNPSANAPADGPVFTWLGHSIHGNETSGMNASLLLLYHLAAAQTPFTQHLLENSIILIDPMINPDGIARFTEWANSHKSYVANPDYQELLEIVRDFSQLENALPYNSERDVVREQMSQKLRERVLTLLAKDEGVEQPYIPPLESKRMTKEELEEQKNVKMKMLSSILERLAVPPMTSPVKARNFAMASKPQGVRLAWVCNWKHAMHSSPCGCAKPHLGGKWVILGKNNTEEIKDDK